MYPIWFLDHFILVTILVVVVTGGFAFAVYRYSLRVSEQHPAKSQLAAFGVQLTIVVLISLLLNNLYGAVRDREQRQWALRQTHLGPVNTNGRVYAILRTWKSPTHSIGTSRRVCRRHAAT